MIGILSDAHGNVAAFRQAIRLLRDMGANQFVFLGDAVGYIPSSEVINELIELGDSVQCLLGNHEAMLLSEDALDKKSDEVYLLQRTREKLSSEQLHFLKKWPTHIQQSYGEFTVLYVHGSPNDYTNGYVYPDSELGAFQVEEEMVFMGHSHHPFIQAHGLTTFVNVGSCGLPRDHGGFAAMATMDPATRDISIYRFDIRDLVAGMLSTGMELHESVLKVFNRRKEPIVGKILPINGAKNA